MARLPLLHPWAWWCMATCMLYLSALLAVVPPSILMVQGVDRHKFRTCTQTAFCTRNRAPLQPDVSKPPNWATHRYAIDPSTAAASQHKFTASALNTLRPAQPALELRVAILESGIVAARVVEPNPLHPRWSVPDATLPSAFATQRTDVKWTVGEQSTVAEWTQAPLVPTTSTSATPSSSTSTTYQLRIDYRPLLLTLLVDGREEMRVNDRGLMNYEQYRARNPRPVSDGSEGSVVPADDPTTQPFEYDESGMWEESFGSHPDSKPRGPSAVTIDVTFPNAAHIYGIPEHASSFALHNTRGTGTATDSTAYNEPYRLYNLDVFEYELNEPMSLYGAVPYIIAHSERATTGFFWLNSAETFVDISSSQRDVGLLSSGTEQRHVQWISESGVLEFFLVAGPTPADLFARYATLTGAAALPQRFAVAYHQCRWNYRDQNDVADVDNGFDEHDIPYDVLWLDIEHTDGKKYFTWDTRLFPDPKAMQDSLHNKGRRMVSIVDPHIKRDAGYHVHTLATERNLYVQTAQGQVYEGWCWPGSVSYLDFLDAGVRDFWVEQFALNAYQGSTLALFTWNDMNEPSVFNGPEVTMPKDCKHLGGTVEHRDVHNLYGFYNQMATAKGLQQRDNQRPFVLTRSFFAGSQRYGAVWTGDNEASWGHLAATTPMLLSMGVAGITFSGADVGGYFRDPKPELLTRWYQAAAFQPFFRGHAHIDTKRREPWLFGEPYTSVIRAAIRARYAFLPYVYTLFQRAAAVGLPVLRPLWVEFPTDTQAFAKDDAFMLGSALLVHPVTTREARSASVYLPTGAVWYEWTDFAPTPGGRTVEVAAPLNYIPVFFRGGSIVPKRERARRASSLMDRDPLTLYVVLDEQQRAAGDLYLDDGRSFEYQRGDFVLRHFVFESGVAGGHDGDNTFVLRSEAAAAASLASSSFQGVVALSDDHSPVYQSLAGVTVERIVLVGLRGRCASIEVAAHASKAAGAAAGVRAATVRPVDFEVVGHTIVVRKPDVWIRDDFTLVVRVE